MPARASRLASATAIMRAAVGGARNGEARRQGFRAGDARVRERRLNRAASQNERGAEMGWQGMRNPDGMRRDQAAIGSRRRSAANSAGATASRAASRSRRAAR